MLLLFFFFAYYVAFFHIVTNIKHRYGKMKMTPAIDVINILLYRNV